MNGVIINIYADASELEYFKEELVNYRHLPVMFEMIKRDDMIRVQMKVASVEFELFDVEIIVFNNGDFEDIIINHDHFDHISIVASNID